MGHSSHLLEVPWQGIGGRSNLDVLGPRSPQGMQSELWARNGSQGTGHNFLLLLLGMPKGTWEVRVLGQSPILLSQMLGGLQECRQICGPGSGPQGTGCMSLLLGVP